MSIEKPATIEEHIVNLLKLGPKTTLWIVDNVKGSYRSRKPTKQGVYKAIRKLRDEQVVAVNNGVVMLHIHFLEALSDYLRQARQTTHQSLVEDTFLQLAEGEKITYNFSTVEKADIFWAHLFGVLIDTLDEKTPLYTYEPHNWFILSSRKSSELRLIKKMHEKNIPFLITVGYKSPLDMMAKEEYAITPNIQYHNEIKPSLGGNNYHLNIFGDVILEIWTDRKSANEIHDFFGEYKTLDEVSRRILESFIHQTGRTRIVISKNSKRSALLKQKLNRYFWIT